MDKTSTLTWIFLVVLTLITVLFSEMQGTHMVVLIMILAGLKFLGVAFQFMELKRAHLFWKLLIVAYLVVFSTLLLMALGE